MSLTFSQITALIDRNCKSNSTSYSLADKTADINLAQDFLCAKAIKAGGTWQWDDSNQTDYPIITTNLVSGQRDYAFTTDEQGNIILDVYRVFIAQPNGTFVELTPVDVQSDKDTAGFYNGLNASGTPTKYDKTGNGIFLDAVPNYSITNGLKLYINRESTYFLTSDTTKKPGFAGIFHEYLALRPSYQYAYRNNLKNLLPLQSEMLRMEKEIERYYGSRQRDVKPGLRVNQEVSNGNK